MSQVFYRYTKNAEARHHHQHHGSRDGQGTDEAGCGGVAVGGGCWVMAADGGGGW